MGTKDVGNVDRYLRARLAADRETERRSAEPEVRPFVTISRQAGAGGLPLAEVMLDAFNAQSDIEIFGGWQVYDRHLCEIVADDPRYADSLDLLLERNQQSWTSDLMHSILGPTTHRTLLMERVFLVVRTLATMGKAIIVGRGGSEVTRGMSQGVSVRLVADEPSRINRMMDLFGLDYREARNTVHKRDADRARLMKDHFEVDIEDPAGYDVTFNTDTTSFEEIAGAVVVLVRGRAALSDSDSGTA